MYKILLPQSKKYLHPQHSVSSQLDRRSLHNDDMFVFLGKKKNAPEGLKCRSGAGDGEIREEEVSSSNVTGRESWQSGE